MKKSKMSLDQANAVMDPADGNSVYDEAIVITVLPTPGKCDLTYAWYT